MKHRSWYRSLSKLFLIVVVMAGWLLFFPFPTASSSGHSGPAAAAPLAAHAPAPVH